MLTLLRLTKTPRMFTACVGSPLGASFGQTIPSFAASVQCMTSARASSLGVGQSRQQLNFVPRAGGGEGASTPLSENFPLQNPRGLQRASSHIENSPIIFFHPNTSACSVVSFVRIWCCRCYVRAERGITTPRTVEYGCAGS